MLITLTDVGHRFGDGGWLFRGLTAQLRPGHSYAIVGPSGSGKSTFLNLVAGWIAPSEGEILRQGEGRTIRVFQNPHGVAQRSAIDHVLLPLFASGLSPESAMRKACRLLKEFGIFHLAEQPFRSLSGGEAQRLMLARAVASRATLLLVDEPTAQLDRDAAELVNDALGRLRAESVTVLIATHDEGTRDACTDIVDLRQVPRFDLTSQGKR